MDALGNIKPVAVRVPAPAQAVPASPPPSNPLPVVGGGDTGFDSAAAETARIERLKQAARNAPQPLGTQSFTMFKDTSGQVITRFRDINSGRVTYIPEPNLLKLGGGGGAGLLNITA